MTKAREAEGVTRDEVRTATRDFLKAVAEAAKSQLGSRPEREQRSLWMVRSGPNSMQSKEFRRMVFNQPAVLMMYQLEMMRKDFPQEQRLAALLGKAGIPQQEVPYGFFLPLLHHWLEVPDPFAFEETGISQILEEFVDAVINGRVVTRSQDAIVSLHLASGPVLLEEGVCIRPVTEEELWEFGTIEPWRFRLFSFSFDHMPTEAWNILYIEIQHDIGQSSRTIEGLRRAALTALPLASVGRFQVIQVELEPNYGVEGAGLMVVGERSARQLGRWEHPYILDAKVAQRLTNSWPGLKEVMESQDHYLRLPAQRLVDGGARERMEDAIIDYAIGLEALLTEGVRDELGYRLALRGATVLAWNAAGRRKFFKDLQTFYKVRSTIVHGRHVAQSKLREACSLGEKALRDVWWWYFQRGASSLKQVTSIIDGRILGDVEPPFSAGGDE